MALDSETRQVIVEKLRAEGAESIELFGSYATGEETADSDVDILVRFGETKTLLEMARIQRELSEATGLEIDLVTEGALSPRIRERVEDEKVALA